VCDWYNPVKGHAQYSLRDERRDRHSGRIWRITAKDRPTQEPAKIADASIDELLDHLKRPEYRIRYWSKRELGDRDPAMVKAALDRWVEKLDPTDPRFRHHQIEAIWTYRWINETKTELLRDLLSCDDHRARAAATQQLRYWHPNFDDIEVLLRRSANDSNAIVRMEAAIAATYIGTQSAFEAMLDVLKHPRAGHVAYAINSAFGSRTIRPFWESNSDYNIAAMLKQSAKEEVIQEPTPTASQASFDRQPNLKRVDISCLPERMLFDVKSFVVAPGQPVKLVFTNPDATDHNLVVVKPDALAEVGMAANEMAKDPRNATSDFIPMSKQSLILHATKMIGPTRASLIDVLRFEAPSAPGVYPYVCTFPGHWVVMNGVMVVAESDQAAQALLAASQPKVIKAWAMEDFSDLAKTKVVADDRAIERGMSAFVKANCHQCHVVSGHGINLGPDLLESVKTFKGEELLRQIIEPSAKIHEKYRSYQFLTNEGRVVTGVIVKEDKKTYQVATNLLTPNSLTTINKKDIDEKIESKVSSMPAGLLDVLTKEEILDLVRYLETAGNLPAHLKHGH
jgi:putative heme-binding domain-containing protein